MEKINVNELVAEFMDIFGGTERDIRVFFAPGRVNLIGEHTDYNNGYVMPFGLQYGTCLVARMTKDPVLKFRSKNFAETAEVCIKKEITRVGNTWINYPLGVVREFVLRDFSVNGLEMLFAGDIPNEAGLSSSASIEIVTSYALNELNNCGLDKLELVRIGQAAENEFVGMKCGIMDQFAVTMGKKDHAVFLDCGTLEYDLVPFDPGDYTIMIINTNKKRGLADSKYNERRSECEQAVKVLSKGKQIGSLSELDMAEFKRHQHLIGDPVVMRRARHVISENERVLAAMEAMKKGDLQTLGALMKQSHRSLRDDYEVSCLELDVVVELADAVEGVLGSRMTGAGFGGCAISLVPKNYIDGFIREVAAGYRKNTGVEASFYEAEPENGVLELNSF